MDWEGKSYIKLNVKFIDGSEKQLWFTESCRHTLLSGRNHL